VERPRAKGRKDRFKPFEAGENGVAPMAIAGEGFHIHVTGLTHDERGYPVMTVEAQEKMLRQQVGKIRNNLDDIIQVSGHRLEDAEIVLVSYGVSARTAYAAVEEAREMGIKAGLLKLLTVWPFPEEHIRTLAQRVKGFITVEVNLGQIFLEVSRCAAGKAPSYLVGHCGGTIISPDAVIDCIKQAF